MKKNHLRDIDSGIDKLNVWFVINTIATVVTALLAFIIAIINLMK